MRTIAASLAEARRVTRYRKVGTTRCPPSSTSPVGSAAPTTGKVFPFIRPRITALAMVVGLATPVAAQDAVVPDLLPGGASSLIETHDNWTVRCEIVTRAETRERACAMGLRQANAQGQQVLAIELTPSADGLTGVLVLPFGLAVTQAVRLTVDEGETIEAAFSTCVPAGCVVPLDAGDTTVAALRAGAELSIRAQNLDGQSLELPVPLQGFAAAAARIDALSQ